MTNPAPVVRIADATDAVAISDLLFEFNGEGLPAADLAQRMAEVQGLETVFLGEWGGELAGLLVLRTAPTLSGPEDWAEITELYVRPEGGRWSSPLWNTPALVAAPSCTCWLTPKRRSPSPSTSRWVFPATRKMLQEL